MTTSRTFIAIPLDSGLQEAIGALQRELSGALPEIRWSAPETVHLTLRFLGETSVDLLEKISASMLSVKLGNRPFEVAIRGVGTFSDARHSRVLWLGLAPSKPLLALYRCCESSLVAAGVPRETRRFAPHLTIGRWREPFAGRLPERLADERNLGRLSVDRVVLYRSRLLAGGARHTPIFTVPLERGDQLCDGTTEEGRDHG